jgi:hypothetical protein
MHNLSLKYTLDFSDSKSEKGAILHEGWSKIEATGRWAIDKKSVIVLPPADKPSCCRISITLRPFTVPGAAIRQKVELWVNGDYIDSKIAVGDSTFSLSFICEKRHISTDGPNVITLKHPNAAKVSEHFQTTDTRVLSFFYHHFAIEPIEDSPYSTAIERGRTLFILTGVCLRLIPLSQACLNVVFWAD